MKMDFLTMHGLVEFDIIEIRGVSGVKATVQNAIDAPELVQVHSMSGKVFDLTLDKATDLFTLTEVK